MDMPLAVIETVNPTAERYGDVEATSALRPASLEGLKIGLLWNGKANGDVALNRAAELIREKVPNVEFRLFSGTMPCKPKLLAELIAECDAAIACTADCGSCTSWITHDCAVLERKGIPTVIIATAGFEHDIDASARAFAFANPTYVVVDKGYNNISIEEAQSQTEPVIEGIIAALTKRAGATDNAGSQAASVRGPLTFSGADYAAAFEKFHMDHMAKDWGDGYPVWPPTRERVDRLVAGSGLAASVVTCVLPPGNGAATVELVAANAAMAGCDPAEMPVVIGALRALAGIRPVPRGALMSTSANAPFFVVNGPIAKKLGINGGRACIGPGKQNEVNLRIGRAILFCLKNIGAWYPGVMDLDSIGTTRKNITVVAENEDESPWEPFHVTRGFKPTDSTVTVFFTSGEWNIGIQGATDPQQLAAAIASFSGGNNGPGYFSTLQQPNLQGYCVYGRLLLLAPPHAIPLADSGFTKRGLEKYMFQNGQEPISRLIEPVRKVYVDGKVKAEWEWLFTLPPEEAMHRTLPVIERSESYSIIVVGSVRAKDILMPTNTDPFIELIREG